MKVKKSLLCTCTYAIVVLFIACCVSHKQTNPLMPIAMAAPLPTLLQDLGQAKAIQYAHLAGLRGDRSQVPAIAASLRTHPDWMYTRTALRSLVRLHATTALPELNNLINSASSSVIVNDAKISQARIQAEAKTQPISRPD